MGNRDLGGAWVACSLRRHDGTTGPNAVSNLKFFSLEEPALAAGQRPLAIGGRNEWRLLERALSHA